MNAQNLWDLIQYDDNTDTCFEANQHWFGDEVSDKAQAEQRG